jgi:outer membrane lipoprotein SlyB
MRGLSVRVVLLPVLLAAGLGACANNGVQPGIVSTSGGSSAQAQTYGNAQQAQGYGNVQPGESGRVVQINDVSMRGGGGGGGSGNGTMVGGLLGGLGGLAIGASGGRGVGGGLIGGVLGAVGGAIAGTIIENHTGAGGGGRGIEVMVQKDSGQTVTVAQRDDGDIQLGDRVQVVQGRGGVAKVVRDSGRQPDYQNGPAPQDYRQTRYDPAPQDYRQSPGNYDPPPQDYRQSQGNYDPPPRDYRQTQYAPPQSTTRSPVPYQRGGYQDYRQSSNPQPGDDPRYGNLE